MTRSGGPERSSNCAPLWVTPPRVTPPRVTRLRVTKLRVALLLLLLLMLPGGCTGDDRPLTGAVRASLSRAAPLHVRLSGTQASENRSNLSALTDLAIKVRRQLLAERSIDVLHASALIDIATARTDQQPLDRAIALLEEVSAIDSLNAAVPNDIAAAYLLRSDAQNSIGDLFSALAHLGRSIELDSVFEEAWFNRAVVLSRLALYNQAEHAWRSYRTTKPDRGWDRFTQLQQVHVDTTARVIQSNWAMLFDRWRQRSDTSAIRSAFNLIDDAPQVAREFISIDVLGEWGLSVQDGRTDDAGRALHFAVELAPELMRQTGASRVQDAVERIRSAAPTELLPLATGHASYAQGRRLYSAGKPVAAKAAFTDAIRALRSARSDFVWYPALYDAGVNLFAGNYAASDSAARAFLQSEAARTSPVLVARAHYLLGLSEARRGRAEAALPYYEEAEHIYERAGETQHHTAMQSLAAEALNLLGRDESSFKRWVASIARLQQEGTATSLHNTLVVFGRSAGRAGFPAAMAAIHEEGLHIADRTGRVSDPIEARMELARAELELGRRTAASRHIAEARTRFQTLSDSTLRQRVEADLGLVEGMVATEDEPHTAIRHLTVAADYFRRQRNQVNLLRVLTARSAAYMLAGDTTSASADLAEAIALSERESLSTMNVQLRASFHEASVRAYNQLIRVHFSRGETDTAFQYLERSRLQLGAARGGRTEPAAVTPGEVARRLPATAMLLEYAVLDDRLLIWAIARDSIHTHEVAISRTGLTDLVQRFVRLARTGSDSIALLNSGRALRSVLLEPVGLKRAGIDELLIVPDNILHSVPFALLPGQSADRFLVEDFTLRMVPGAALVRAQAQQPFSPKSTVLLAGDVPANPAYPELSRLPAAQPELRRIAQLYDRPMRLQGVAATPAALMKDLAKIDILHFSGHARFISDQPHRSHLVLTPDSPNDSGLLFAEQLAQVPLHPSGLVILSACSSGSRTPTRTGGLSGLAQAFISAGAAGVVGSLWEVEDSGTGRLLVAFHDALVSGSAPAEALRSAQRSLIRNSKPAVWGAFRYEGL